MKPHSLAPITCKAGLVGCQVLLSRGACQGPREQHGPGSAPALGQGRAAGCSCVAGAVTAAGILSSTSSKPALLSSQGTPRATAPWRNSCTITREVQFEPLRGDPVCCLPSGRYPSSLGVGGGWGRVPRPGVSTTGPHAFLGLLYFLPPMGTQCRVLGEGDSCSSRGLGPGGGVSGSGQQSLAGG